jgi:RNA polymerase sigma factor (sigma-70 family)
MPDANDMDLVREYAARNSEPAFETLVRRHVSMVYSVALRQVGNPAQAEEITQAVFLILARKAARLRPDTILPGWLHETARFASASFLRGELRRQRREQEAYVQSKLQESTTDPAWEQLAPLLDEAIGKLGKADRNAVVLRFFQNKSAREIAAALNVHESAAQKRLNRAVEKLRAWFLKRGVAVSADALTGALLIHSVQGAPAHLAASVLAASTKGTAVSSSTLTLIKGALKIMAWTKAKTAIVIGTATILTIGTGVFVVEEIAAPGGSDAERGPVEMQMKWQAGKKYVMHSEATQTSETQQPNQPKPVKQLAKMTQDFNLTPVRQLDNGGRQLQLEFESLAVDVSEGSRKTFSADSSQNSAPDAENPAGVRLHKMVGARLQYFINANGKVEKMEGYPELVKRVAGENPQEQATFRSLFNENVLKQYGSVGEDTTPRRVVKLGDRWAARLEVPADIGMLNLDLKSTFKNWEQHANHKCMRIKFTGEFSLQAVPNTPNPRVKLEKAGLSGELWFDPELGMVVEMTFDADLNLKINQRGQIQTIRSNQKTRYALLAVEDVAK